jgi:hypothetical protein
MAMSRARAALILAGVFVLGVVCGAFGTAALHRHWVHRGFAPERMERFIVERLSRRLDLDADQRRVLEDATRKARIEIEQVRRETLPRIEAILDRATDELRPVLRPEQQTKLEAIRSEMKERLRRHAPRD